MSEYFNGPWLERERNTANMDVFRNIFQGKPCLFDLGAAGGTPPPFFFLGDNVDVVNFEPDKRAKCEGNRKTYPIAIGPKDLNQIFLNRRPTTSSLLPANKRITDRYDWSRIFGSNADIFETLSVETIETEPIDGAMKRFDLPKPDFIKIDVQGLGLEVLQGGIDSIFNSVLGIEIEVEFFECYSGQKTMGCIHEFLHENGFEIFRVKNLNAWYYKTQLSLSKYSGQDTFCDFIYFRSIDSIDKNPTFWTKERALSCIQLLLLYDLTDAAAAYYEKFKAKNLLGAESIPELERLICGWRSALEFFYLPKPLRLKAILSISPMDIIKWIRKMVKTQFSSPNSKMIRE